MGEPPGCARVRSHPGAGYGLAGMRDIEERVVGALRGHRAVRSIRLVGSRVEGRANPRSDWDFRVETIDFPALAGDLPALLAPLEPLAQQWDRLSEHQCWMVMLPGPVKIDLIFLDEPHQPEPAWIPSAGNLEAIDHHFLGLDPVAQQQRGSGQRGPGAGGVVEALRSPAEPAGSRSASVHDGRGDPSLSRRSQRSRRTFPGTDPPRPADRGLRIARCLAVTSWRSDRSPTGRSCCPRCPHTSRTSPCRERPSCPAQPSRPLP
jgi:hypothetical protein